MAKRGASGLSLVVGVDKPCGMTSHDVVNRARRIFGERRVGHAGTLDPMASGALPVLVGPATRLSDQLTGHDKDYRARIAFGASTTTDDAEGEVLHCSPVPAWVLDSRRAQQALDAFLGPSQQLPPAYSAIKVAGRKACDEARRGNVIELAPRAIEVRKANLVGLGEQEGAPFWDVDFSVSKGTYIRALARDIGRAAGTHAHLGALRRMRAGNLLVEDCVPLEALEQLGQRAALDPVRLLGHRFAFVDGDVAKGVANGCPISAEHLALHAFAVSAQNACACTSGAMRSPAPPADGEAVSVIMDNTLKALYAFSARTGRFEATCVFQGGVARGAGI